MEKKQTIREETTAKLIEGGFRQATEHELLPNALHVQEKARKHTKLGKSTFVRRTKDLPSISNNLVRMFSRDEIMLIAQNSVVDGQQSAKSVAVFEILKTLQSSMELDMEVRNKSRHKSNPISGQIVDPEFAAANPDLALRYDRVTAAINLMANGIEHEEAFDRTGFGI